MAESFDTAKTLPTCDALVNCVSAADHMHPRIATHCISYAIGEKVVLRGAIKILSAYAPSKRCPRRGFEPCIRTINNRQSTTEQPPLFTRVGSTSDCPVRRLPPLKRALRKWPSPLTIPQPSLNGPSNGLHTGGLWAARIRVARPCGPQSSPRQGQGLGQAPHAGSKSRWNLSRVIQ